MVFQNQNYNDFPESHWVMKVCRDRLENRIIQPWEIMFSIFQNLSIHTPFESSISLLACEINDFSKIQSSFEFWKFCKNRIKIVQIFKNHRFFIIVRIFRAINFWKYLLLFFHMEEMVLQNQTHAMSYQGFWEQHELMNFFVNSPHI